MVERYIYTRSERNFLTASGAEVNIGHGFVAQSQGVRTRTCSELLKYCGEYECDYFTADGEPMPVDLRYYIPETDEVVLQRMRFIQPQRARGFCYAYGYLLGGGSRSVYCPEAWMQQDYPCLSQDEIEALDLRAEEELPFHPAPFPALTEALEGVGLSLEQMKELVHACFDAVNRKEQIYVFLDWKQPVQDLCRREQAFLTWLYHFLPFYMRKIVGYASVYTKRALADTFQIVFMPETEVTYHQRTERVRINGVRVRNHFIFENGRSHHAPREDECEFSAAPSTFSRWLDMLVDQAEAVPQAGVGEFWKTVDGYFDRLDREMAELTPQQKTDPDYYSALCWHLAESGALPSSGQQMPDCEVFSNLIILTQIGKVNDISGLLRMELAKQRKNLTGPLDRQAFKLLQILMNVELGNGAVAQDVAAFAVEALRAELREPGNIAALERYADGLAGELRPRESLYAMLFFRVVYPDDRNLGAWIEWQLSKLKDGGVQDLFRALRSLAAFLDRFQPDVREKVLCFYRLRFSAVLPLEELSSWENVQQAILLTDQAAETPSQQEDLDQMACATVDRMTELCGAHADLRTIRDLGALNEKMRQLQREPAQQLWRALYLAGAGQASAAAGEQGPQVFLLDDGKTGRQILRCMQEALLTGGGSGEGERLRAAACALAEQLCACVCLCPAPYMDAAFYQDVTAVWEQFGSGRKYKLPDCVQIVKVLGRAAASEGPYGSYVCNNAIRELGIRRDDDLFRALVAHYLTGNLPAVEIEFVCEMQRMLKGDPADVMHYVLERGDETLFYQWLHDFVLKRNYFDTVFEEGTWERWSVRRNSPCAQLLASGFQQTQWLDRMTAANPQFVEDLLEELLHLESRKRIDHPVRKDLSKYLVEYLCRDSKMGSMLGGMKYRKYLM